MTLSTSATNERERRSLRRSALGWLITAVVVAAAGRVYQYFGHDVWSVPMTYAFFYPLIGGALPLTLCALCPVRVQPGRLCRWTLGAGLSTLTVGSVLSGVLEIYGTSSRLLGVYRVVGWLWVLAAAGLYAAGWFSPASRRPGRHCPGGESEKK